MQKKEKRIENLLASSLILTQQSYLSIPKDINEGKIHKQAAIKDSLSNGNMKKIIFTALIIKKCSFVEV